MNNVKFSTTTLRFLRPGVSAGGLCLGLLYRRILLGENKNRKKKAALAGSLFY